MRATTPAFLALALALAGGASTAGCSQSDSNKTRSATDDALIVAQVAAKAAAIDPATVQLVKVTCSGGTVTLDGKIATMDERMSVEKAAHDVDGVRGVIDNLVVDSSAPTGQQIASDLTLATRVRAALAAQTGINSARLHVDVHRGVVTLSGELPSSAHRDVADQTVRAVHGVVSVIDKITIEH